MHRVLLDPVHKHQASLISPPPWSGFDTSRFCSGLRSELVMPVSLIAERRNPLCRDRFWHARRDSTLSLATGPILLIRSQIVPVLSGVV